MVGVFEESFGSQIVEGRFRKINNKEDKIREYRDNQDRCEKPCDFQANLKEAVVPRSQ